MDLVVADVPTDSTSACYSTRAMAPSPPRCKYQVGFGGQQSAAADLDGDGMPDLAVPNLDGNTVGVLFNQGNGTFADPVYYPAGQRPTAVAAADLNGDGLPDLTVTNQETGSVSVLFNEGKGTFSAPVNYPTDPVGGVLLATDLSNNDGVADVAVLTDDSVTLLLGSCVDGNRGAGGTGATGG